MSFVYSLQQEKKENFVADFSKRFDVNFFGKKILPDQSPSGDYRSSPQTNTEKKNAFSDETL